MQLTGGKKPPVGILYDSDFGARIDTILALAMLHGMETKQQAASHRSLFQTQNLRQRNYVKLLRNSIWSRTRRLGYLPCLGPNGTSVGLYWNSLRLSRASVELRIRHLPKF